MINFYVMVSFFSYNFHMIKLAIFIVNDGILKL